MFPMFHVRLLLALMLSFAACRSSRSAAEDTVTRDALAGVWRVVLDSPGGELPFTIEIFPTGQPGPGGAPAIIRNGEEAVPFSEVSISGRRVNLRIEHRDTALTGVLDAGGNTLMGTWQLTTNEGSSTLPIKALRGQSHRFDPRPERTKGAFDALSSVAGTWRIELDRDPTFVGIADFQQTGDEIRGTVMHAEGTYRYLVGQYRDGVLRLSTFNGGMAVLMRGYARADGTLTGEIWLDDEGFYQFRATSMDSDDPLEALPDPTEIVTVKSEDRRLHFKYPDTEGQPVGMDDVRFEGKVVLVELFGTWCSNCNDAAPHLQEWYQRYRKRGFEAVGLAFEHTGDRERDLRQVKAYKEYYGIEFPLLIAGTTTFTQEPLPELSMSPAFPTMIFIGRDGTIHTVLNGFLGPSAGKYYRERVARMEAIIEELLEE